jgi:hypothetical protein
MLLVLYGSKRQVLWKNMGLCMWFIFVLHMSILGLASHITIFLSGEKENGITQLFMKWNTYKKIVPKLSILYALR